MTLKQKLLAALRSGGTHETLLEMLRAHHGELVGPKAAYEILEQVWLDLGFDDTDEESQVRNELEFTMERVWYTSIASTAQS